MKGNTITYLQENATDTWWWSLSPSYFDGGFARVWCVSGSGGSFGGVSVGDTFGVRPSISLKSTTKVTGDGTRENPYIVVT